MAVREVVEGAARDLELLGSQAVRCRHGPPRRSPRSTGSAAAAAGGELAGLCDELGLRLLVVFGGTLQEGRAGRARDLDIGVSWRPDAERDVIRVMGALVDLLRFDGVDLMDLDCAGAVAREQALAYGLPLFEDRPGLFARLQMAAITERMDTAWLRRLSLERLAR